jgi:hypothetical protein
MISNKDFERDWSCGCAQGAHSGINVEWAQRYRLIIKIYNAISGIAIWYTIPSKNF